MHSLTWVVCFISMILPYTPLKCQVADKVKTKPQPTTCIYKDHEGKMYNITALANTNEKPRFYVVHKEYKYSFNPCLSFKMGPSTGSTGKQNQCLSNVAICRSVEGQEYLNIGMQNSSDFDADTDIPKLKFHSANSFWISTVSLTCDLAEDKGKFEVIKVRTPDDIELNLTHKCACPNKCLEDPVGPVTKDPTATDAPGDVKNIVIPVVASVAGVVVLCVVPFVIWRLLKRQPDNERRHLLPDGNDGARGIDETNNDFPAASEGSELTSGGEFSSLTKPSSTGSSSCNDIKVSSKDDSDCKNRSYAEGVF